MENTQCILSLCSAEYSCQKNFAWLIYMSAIRKTECLIFLVA